MVSTSGAQVPVWNYQRVIYLPSTATNRTSSLTTDPSLMLILPTPIPTLIGPLASKHANPSAASAFALPVAQLHINAISN